MRLGLLAVLAVGCGAMGGGGDVVAADGGATNDGAAADVRAISPYEPCGDATPCAPGLTCLAIALGDGGAARRCTSTCTAPAGVCPAPRNQLAPACVTVAGSSQCYEGCRDDGDCYDGLHCTVVGPGQPTVCAP